MSLVEQMECAAGEDTARALLAPYRDRDVVLGLRPEDIGSARAMQDASMPKLKAKVDVIEPMGSEAYVYLSVGTSRFVARTDPHQQFRVGSSVELPVFIDKARFFDATTEKRIR